MEQLDKYQKLSKELVVAAAAACVIRLAEICCVYDLNFGTHYESARQSYATRLFYRTDDQL
eukprot:18094-Heterococcus_DN1.PRE.1